jgi:hypothetical protein
MREYLIAFVFLVGGVLGMLWAIYEIGKDQR